MPSGFDRIAPYYDSLASLVFGNQLMLSKKHFLQQIPANSKIMMIGGGTGNMLNEILHLSAGNVVDYIEASAAMLQIAREKVDRADSERVHFIHGTQLQIPSNAAYDAVTVFFLMDCMKQEAALEFINLISSKLKEDGLLLFADFFPAKKIYQRFLLWLMYLFFRLTAGIPTGKLPHYDAIFYGSKLQETGRSNFMNGFIQSRCYRKR